VLGLGDALREGPTGEGLHDGDADVPRFCTVKEVGGCVAIEGVERRQHHVKRRARDDASQERGVVAGDPDVVDDAPGLRGLNGRHRPIGARRSRQCLIVSDPVQLNEVDSIGLQPS